LALLQKTRCGIGMQKLGGPRNVHLTSLTALLLLACLSTRFLTNAKTDFVVFQLQPHSGREYPPARSSATSTLLHSSGEHSFKHGHYASRVVIAGSAVLSSLLVGLARGQSLRKRDSVRCHAGFEGSGLTGKWGCYKTEGDIDAYWKATGLPWLARKGLQLMDWGAGKNQNIREFLQEGDSIRMEYSFDGPGLGGLGFTETYTVGNGIQEITRMGGAKILVDPSWESDKVLRVQNMNPAKQTKGWAKTLLSGGQDEDSQQQMVAGEKEDAPLGDVIDVHRFYLEDDSLVLEADSSQSGGPVVKWFLKRLI